MNRNTLLPPLLSPPLSPPPSSPTSLSFSLTPPPPSTTYWLARYLFLRYISFIHVISFWTSIRQSKGLLGSKGNKLQERGKGGGRSCEDVVYGDLANHPSSNNHFCDFANTIIAGINAGKRKQDGSEGRKSFAFLRSDFGVSISHWLGLATSVSMLLGFRNPTLLSMLTVLFCYNNLSATGGVFYGFGWESLLYESTILSLLLVPASQSTGLFNPAFPVSKFAVWLFRWLSFR